jgi:sulfate transport system permease protein
MGYTIFYLGLLVLVPLSALILRTTALGPSQFWDIVTNGRAIAAYKLTFGASAVGALINAAMGLLLAWVLVRYQFIGKSIVDALIDLPFALPTAVAGIAMTTAYAEKGLLGAPLGASG